MEITTFSFGSIERPFGHTPLSLEEPIPWQCRRLVIGTGAHGALPVMGELQREAQRRKGELLALHVTC